MIVAANLRRFVGDGVLGPGAFPDVSVVEGSAGSAPRTMFSIEMTKKPFVISEQVPTTKTEAPWLGMAVFLQRALTLFTLALKERKNECENRSKKFVPLTE